MLWLVAKACICFTCRRIEVVINNGSVKARALYLRARFNLDVVIQRHMLAVTCVKQRGAAIGPICFIHVYRSSKDVLPFL